MAGFDDHGVVPLPVGLLAPSGLRKSAPEQPPAITDGIVVNIEAPQQNGVSIDPSGALLIEDEDGSVSINFNPDGGLIAPERKSNFDSNLADFIGTDELARISEETLRGIQFDENSRREWLETRAQGIRILALEIEEPRSSVDSTTSLEGMSTIRHPVLLEATLHFQSNARGELLPADGPVKVIDSLSQTGQNDALSEQLETDFNYYLTEVATEYYPDTDRMLLYVGFGGCGFKKVYNCPLRQRPVSESVDAEDMIVSNAATDMRNSGRVTHRIKMRQSTLKRMQLAGAYRDISVITPTGVTPNPVDVQIASVQGIDPQTTQQTEDREHTIYETYCELDIKGYEHKKNGVPTGLALPYRVVIDKDSRQVLEVRRNWREKDETQSPKLPFVKYSYVPGLGFYDIGLIHILGNTAQSLTAAWRLLLDSGMFSNFPGFLYSKILGRQNTNEFRVAPGQGAPVDTQGQKISDAIMPLPYKDVSTAFAGFAQHIEETAQRVGGTAEINIGEGRQDAPVGTTLALLEQATKVESAVHKRLTQAQSEEFQLLKECFRENPMSFVKAMTARGHTDWDEQSFLAALGNAAITPVADPNTPSHMHRLMKAIGIVQLDKQYPGVMDGPKVVKRVAAMMRVDDFDELLADPTAGPPGVPPEVQLEMAKLADKDKERQAKVAADQRKAQLIAMQAQSDQQQYAHAERMQQRESADQQQDRQNRSLVASVGFRESMMDNAAQLEAERIKARTALVETATDREETAAKLKIAEHGTKQSEHSVQVAKHGVDAAKHQAEGAKASAKAAARKPAAKPKK